MANPMTPRRTSATQSDRCRTSIGSWWQANSRNTRPDESWYWEYWFEREHSPDLASLIARRLCSLFRWLFDGLHWSLTAVKAGDVDDAGSTELGAADARDGRSLLVHWEVGSDPFSMRLARRLAKRKVDRALTKQAYCLNSRLAQLPQRMSPLLALGRKSRRCNNFGSYVWFSRRGERIDFMPGLTLS